MLAGVLAIPLPIQYSANMSYETVDDGSNTWVSAPSWKTKWKLWLPALAWFSPDCCWHLESISVHRRSFFLFLLFCLSNDENKQISVFSGTMGGIIRSLEKNLKIMWFNTALYQVTPNNFYFLLIYTQIKDFHNLLHFGKK